MASRPTRRTADLSGGGKNILVAYLLWWFLGALGVHRFYLDRPKSGLAQILLLAFGWLPLFLGWIALGLWWLFDAYFVYIYVNECNATNGGSPLAASLTTTVSTKGDLEYLEKLHSMKERGLITDEEYAERRLEVMG